MFDPDFRNGRTRNPDWTSSIMGAQSVAYRAGSQKARLLDAYQQAYPLGLTDDEAAVAAGLPLTSCYWKRCGELRQDMAPCFLNTSLIFLNAFSRIAICNGVISLVPFAHFGLRAPSLLASRISLTTDCSSAFFKKSSLALNTLWSPPASTSKVCRKSKKARVPFPKGIAVATSFFFFFLSPSASFPSSAVFLAFSCASMSLF